jgi:DNA-binding transcriptional MerR regulator
MKEIVNNQMRQANEARDAGQVRGERLLTIGQVVDQLRPEFSDLSITKVRYLEDRGLLSPARTPGRYRKYNTSDVRRLRTILTLQRDEYLPLEVIRERVQRGAGAHFGQPLHTPGQAGTAAALRREEATYSWEEVHESAGLDDDLLKTLAEYHLIERPDDSGSSLTETDVEIARICHALARFGVEPRNLRLLHSSAEREASMIEQVAAPSLLSTHPDKREQGERMLEELGALVSQLLTLLLYKELRAHIA